MKLFLSILLCIAITNEISAQGITKYGQSIVTSTNFVDKAGKLGTTTTLNKNGYVLVLPSITTTAATNMTSTTANPSGNITSDGGAAVTTRGICWSVTTNPTILNNKSANGSGKGIFSNSISLLSPSTTYYFRAYATNSVGTAYGAQMSFTTSPLVLGDPYLGGKVAYFLQSGDPGYSAAEKRGLIAATSDIANARWYNLNPSTTGAVATAIGTGNANTMTIVNSQGAGTYAAKSCYDLVLNGFDDWYLPSKDEIYKLYLNRAIIGGFAANYYWSSSEYNSGYAWCPTFDYGAQDYNDKYNSFNVRPVRSFPVLPMVTTSAVNAITSTSVNTGGDISSDCGAPVTARGVCWSVSPNAINCINSTSDGLGTGTFTSSITNLAPNTTYYLRAFATNSVGTAYGPQISFTTTALAVGDNYQGGKVAYILKSGDPGYNANVVHGFIAAMNDQSAGIQWYNGSNTTTGATATALGNGNSNTNTIVTAQGVGSYAAQLCRDLVLNNYSDWYLPGKDELNKLYLNRNLIGSFNDLYWSSSENNSFSAWAQSFMNGTQNPIEKLNTSAAVRAVRSFTGLLTVTTTTVSSITPTTATCGGNVTSDGDAPITAKGVCWSLTPVPTIADFKTNDGTGTGVYSSSLTGLTLDKTYYVRAYATNSVGTEYGKEISFTTGIGATYQGGIIAYILQPGDPGYNVSMKKGLIVSPSNLDFDGAIWGCYSTTIGGTSTTYGSGQTNTNLILNGCLTVGIAAKLCNDFVLNGYSDWYLPSKDELNKLFLNRNTIGNGLTNNGIFWSSSESNVLSGWNQSFWDGSQSSYYKKFTCNVRAVRSFPSIASLTTTAVSSITIATATCGGNVINDGGDVITARGVCWNIQSNPTVDLSTKTIDNGTSGLYTSSITGLNPVTIYYVRAYATNSLGTAYGPEVSFTTPVLAIGDNYQGGKVAYILQNGDPGYNSSVPHGLIAAPSDQSSEANWGCPGTIMAGTDGYAIGTGNQNTIDAITGCSTAGTAARICGNLVMGGYSDWYLPSKDELNKLYLNKNAIGGFSTLDYWSSTRNDNFDAWRQYFLTGFQDYSNKNMPKYVRAVRSF